MSVLVYIEVRDGVAKKASLEALSEAKRLGAAFGGVSAVIAGKGLDGAVEAAKAHGADKVYVAENDQLSTYVPEGYLTAVVEAAKQADAKVVIAAATSQGRDLAPRAAAKMGVMLMPDVTAISSVDGQVQVTRPVYAGKVYMTLKTKSLPVVITTRPNIFDLAETAGAGEKVALEVSFEAKAKVVEVKAAGGDKLDVAEADRIVSGGRGLKEPENFKLIEDLASTLGAAVGATRAVVDAGWRPHSEQVGQTGKTVGPTLYIAVGISGAVQHLAGMRTSKVIVAINKDADAPIFKIADYGLVGDALEILPKLNEALKG
ncbi:MAG: electron transfer flavoprotein subunit alpha/FixB family protein [bacterium]